MYRAKHTNIIVQQCNATRSQFVTKIQIVIVFDGTQILKFIAKKKNIKKSDVVDCNTLSRTSLALNKTFVGVELCNCSCVSNDNNSQKCLLHMVKKVTSKEMLLAYLYYLYRENILSVKKDGFAYSTM